MFRPHAQYEVLPDYWGTPRAAETEYNAGNFHMRTLPKVPSSHTYSFISTSDPDALNTGWTSGHGKGPRVSSSKSWRVGARWTAAAATLSLMINLGAGIWAAVYWGLGDSIAQIYRGDCARVEKFNIWVHLAINVLSTVLLSGSNYCMQCLSAPSREEVNAAHAKGKWLDIGIPSVHNLRSISTKKVGLWWCLGLSSVPLHLMYNSAFFSSLATNDYNIVYATEDFVTGAPFDNTNAIGGAWRPPGYDVTPVQEQIASYERLENAACIEAYAKDFITYRRTLVIIASNSSTESGSLLGSDNYELISAQPGIGWAPYNWMCNDQDYTYETNFYYCFQVISAVIANAQNWKPDNFSAQYCLSERVPGTCGFNMNLIIILVVVICNAGKLAGMLYVAFGSLEDPLITVGDAVSSFLASPDHTTRDMCLVSRKDIVKASRFGGMKKLRAPKYWRPVGRRWFNAASKTRWWTCILLFLSALGVIGGLLSLAVLSISISRSTSIQSLWGLGFGQVHGETLITGWALEGLTSEASAVIANVLIANSPQALLSFLYLTLNGLLTSMFLADEWSRFAKERKPLRVSSPTGLQRRTYFLQLPYRIALPLLVMSGLLHWLVSQSIFLAIVSEYDEVGNENNRIAIATCGFSPIAMICVMVAGGCIIAFALTLGFRKFPPEMPVAGSCSMAISAACHPAPGEGVIASTEALQWGVVPGMLSAEGAGHCCFSRDRVGPLIPGHMYAGVIGEKTGGLNRRK